MPFATITPSTLGSARAVMGKEARLRLLEHEGKQLLRAAGIPVPPGVIVQRGDALEAAAVGRPGGLPFPVVVKAQIPVGGRMKAGAIRFAEDHAELDAAVSELLGAQVGAHRVGEVLVEARAEVAGERYLAVTYDPAAKSAVAVFSPSGGVDVEEGGDVRRVGLPLLFEPSAYRFRELLAAGGVDGREIGSLGVLFARLARLFRERDCLLAEINPLALTAGGSALALDVHLELDDDALFRHGDLVSRWGLDRRDAAGCARTPLERRAAEVDAADHRGVAGRVVEFPGTLGLLIGGGGASLTAFDAVRRFGGDPANYCEIGGNPSVWKVKELTKLLLRRQGVERVAVIMNVVSNTRTDLVARGVIKGVLELGMDPAERIAVFRVPGAWEDEGVRILRRYGVAYADRSVSIDEAARAAAAAGGGASESPRAHDDASNLRDAGDPRGAA